MHIHGKQRADLGWNTDGRQNFREKMNSVEVEDITAHMKITKPELGGLSPVPHPLGPRYAGEAPDALTLDLQFE